MFEDKEKLATAVKWGVALVFCALIAPVVFLSIQGMIGLLIAGGIGLVGINAAPVIALKVKNAKTRAIDAEKVQHMEKVQDAAATNPIETLMQQAHEKRIASDQFRVAITSFRTEVKNFADQIAGFKKEYPEDADRFERQLAAMNKLLAFREDRYKQLQVELDNFDAAIKRASAMWKMAQAAQKMNKLAGAEIGDPFERIKADAAINSVMGSMNKAFAEMETALLDNKEVQQANMASIGHSQPVTLQYAPVTEVEKVRV